MMAWGRKADGTDDVAIFTGTVDWDGRRLAMLRSDGEPPFEVPDDWLDRLKSVDPDLRPDLLGAEYYFSVTIGPLPAGADVSQYLETGLRWPPDNSAS